MAGHFHTVVIGGGCLGCASAISVQRRLRPSTDTAGDRVCLVEKSLVGSGLTARHSGIVRAANAVPKAAYLAKRATDYWQYLRTVWGVSTTYDVCGAVWIVFGEIVGDCIAGEGEYERDIDKFSIARFDAEYMKNFWQKVSGTEHSLEAEAASL